ncbi:hypothetical protein NZNM25_03030 [Nitrosopumilus zosterae]|uniref:Uncharacterized protein n=1 Tax=Nitrosopumilus zosterae TaxID=718286 RepID=A0A2S2KPE0_9ARCH|nr:hypothetical protein [Nitrosopumilus zosterae]BDQ31302.1 hypothetical protein NZOSNM25_001415 [Nitrosopumilus zosterae]GBH33512.1 hypothetical protein NZNM25_03030 [Nitrosopumilus zosterae]
MVKNSEEQMVKKLNEIKDLLMALRDLSMLQASYSDIPTDKISKAAHMQKSRVYEIIPKQKKTSNTKKVNKNAK